MNLKQEKGAVISICYTEAMKDQIFLRAWVGNDLKRTEEGKGALSCKPL